MHSPRCRPTQRGRALNTVTITLFARLELWNCELHPQQHNSLPHPETSHCAPLTETLERAPLPEAPLRRRARQQAGRRYWRWQPRVRLTAAHRPLPSEPFPRFAERSPGESPVAPGDERQPLGKTERLSQDDLAFSQQEIPPGRLPKPHWHPPRRQQAGAKTSLHTQPPTAHPPSRTAHGTCCRRRSRKRIAGHGAGCGATRFQPAARRRRLVAPKWNPAGTTSVTDCRSPGWKKDHSPAYAQGDQSARRQPHHRNAT
mmetsp:Transcript_18457/g.40795  ORF Transcript_18457/g.40795 Transcript_18457/m.40795 type:complete len:258 (+) Transcript_18457:60-833(+)